MPASAKQKKSTLYLNDCLPNRGGMSWKVPDDADDVSAIGCLNTLVFRNIIHASEKAE